MSFKLIGGILLIVGTSIGAGMLALPIATSPLAFTYSTAMLFFCWLMMTVSAFLILEVNLWLPRNSNLISMAKATLGRGGQLVAWLTYLLLLYSLLAAYIAGGSDLLRNMLSFIKIIISNTTAAVIFAITFGYIVYRGIRSVDLVNRLLMALKMSALLLLIIYILPHVSSNYLLGEKPHYVSASLTVALTSFGYATIIPSLRSYFHDDIKKLRLAILIGSIIPLVCYIAWDLAIMGVIPRQGDNGLLAMMQSNRSNSEFLNQLSLLMHNEMVTTLARIFTSICLLTSFLGVALCLSDFLLDGLKLKHSNRTAILVNIATLLPPLLIVLFYPGAFITALSYAGILCVILLNILPALMAWRGRYYEGYKSEYSVPGGKLLLFVILSISALIILQNVL